MNPRAPFISVNCSLFLFLHSNPSPPIRSKGPPFSDPDAPISWLPFETFVFFIQCFWFTAISSPCSACPLPDAHASTVFCRCSALFLSFACRLPSPSDAHAFTALSVSFAATASAQLFPFSAMQVCRSNCSLFPFLFSGCSSRGEVNGQNAPPSLRFASFQLSFHLLVKRPPWARFGVFVHSFSLNGDSSPRFGRKFSAFGSSVQNDKMPCVLGTNGLGTWALKCYWVWV